MDSTSQFIVPTIIDVPELIVTNEDIDFDDAGSLVGGAWVNKLHFLSSALSYVIGLGNLWRFPYLCYKHGGGAFLVTYTFVNIVIGLPLFLMELAFGQYANEGPITIWRISPVFEGIGYTMCFISAMVALYYNMINTWILHYLFASITFSALPWSTCDNSWNSAQCFFKPDVPTISCNIAPQSSTTTSNSSSVVNSTTISPSLIALPPTMTSYPVDNQTFSLPENRNILFNGNCPTSNSTELEKIINSTNEVILPANEYFHNNVLFLSNSISETGAFNWDIFFGLIATWSAVFLLTLKDVRPQGRLALVTVVMPYLSLLALLARAVTLPGSASGISYYLTPQWYRLQTIDIWADATTQIFFALSPCWGGIITLASMNKFHNNFHADSMLIVGSSYATSLLAGLITFATLGHMSGYSGIVIEEVAESGLGLVFMVYTELLAKLPLASLNSIMFFAIFLFLGLNSQLTVIETVMTTIVDTWPHKLRYRKPLILMVLCSVMFILSLTMCFGNGFYLVQLLDTFAGTYTAMTVGVLELIAIAWVYGMENFMQDIDDMISVHRNLFPSRGYWYCLWRYLTPSLLFAILLFSFIDNPISSYRKVELPAWTSRFGWTVTILCLLAIPTMAVVRYLLSPSGSFVDKISYLCRPSEDWAPSSYVSGPKLLDRHMMSRRDSEGPTFLSQTDVTPYHDDDQESNDSSEDLKVVNGRANYIIPEEEDDTDTELIANETNV